ncbi:Chemotaxis protein CheY [compost metagenome]
MPVMNGIDAVREIVKADPEARVLICSSLGQHEVIIEAFKAGAKDFIVKPFQNDKIKQSITNLLK